MGALILYKNFDLKTPHIFFESEAVWYLHETFCFTRKNTFPVFKFQDSHHIPEFFMVEVMVYPLSTKGKKTNQKKKKAVPADTAYRADSSVGWSLCWL